MEKLSATKVQNIFKKRGKAANKHESKRRDKKEEQRIVSTESIDETVIAG